MLTNFEWKAQVQDLLQAEQKLLQLSPRFIGIDLQTDTYFNAAQGRLKLRQGNIENALIHYERKNTPGAKSAAILLYQANPSETLKDILTRALGVLAVVQKKRKIYFIENVKFHFDQVEGLGTFAEVEAINEDEQFSVQQLQDQCDYYASLFNIQPGDYVADSYSDMILQKPG